MKIIDKNGRLFGKISVIDVVVVLVVAILALALHTKQNEREITGSAANDIVITYQITANGLYPYVADAIQVGDQVYESERSTGGTLGKIVDIQRLPGTKMATMADGTMGMVPVENGVDLILTVEGKGIVSEGRYLLNRIYDLGLNANRTLNTTYTEFMGYVSDIQNGE